ncbi:phytoene dehydrogenase [Nocardia sp. MDA0666]|nr:phytoene dehydrogenase [Nocardia sp. MDA0666]
MPVAAAEPARWDAVVVGAGIGGLVCAGYLTACGYRVLVAEQHDVAGGNAHAFRRRRAYEFDVGVHYLGDCGPDGILPAILRGLGVRDRVDLRPMNFRGFDRLVLPNRTIDVPVGWEPYTAALCAAVPGESAGITACTQVLASVAAISRAALVDPNRAVQLARRYPDGPRWGRRSLTRLFDECRLSPVVRTVLSAQAGNYGAGPAQVTVATHATVQDHYLRGAYYVDGGGQTLVAALVEAIEAYGGRVSTRKAVRTIHTDGGVVSGVSFADGDRADSDLVISNADFRRTVLELCSDTAAFGVHELQRTASARMRHAWSVLYLGLATEPPGLDGANLWYFDHEDIEHAYRRFETGSGGPPFAFVSCASARPAQRPWACPPGHAGVQVMVPCAEPMMRWGNDIRYRRDPQYRLWKRHLTAELLTAAERALGPIIDDAVHVEVATPLTHRRYLRSTGGTPYGVADWGGIARRPETETGVNGLHVVGQSTRYGSGVAGAAISGIRCAGRIVGSDLLGEVYRGAVPADRTRLPPRSVDADPLAVSRGKSRRDAPGLPKLPLTRS